MSNLYPISVERHSGKGWTRPSNFDFAARDSVVQINGQELVRACSFLPSAFIKPKGEFLLVLLTGLQRNKNLLVAPNGSWIGKYIPEIYQAYPFRILMTEEGEPVLCVDEASGLIVDMSDNTKEQLSYPFYDDSNQVSSQLSSLKDPMLKLLQKQELTTKICAFYQDYELLKPWPIKFMDGQSKSDKDEKSNHQLEGLYCIDENAINQLEPTKLAELRDLGGLWLACCQRISMSHMKNLAELSKRHNQVSAPSFSLESDNNEGNISFDHL